MKHKRNHYRPFPLNTAVIAAEFINRHIGLAFGEFLTLSLFRLFSKNRPLA